MMMKIVPILFVLQFNVPRATLERNASDYDASKGLIANGRPYDTAKYPFVVYLLKMSLKNFKSEVSLCTGSLISERFVLTAAHCTDGVTRYGIIVVHPDNSERGNAVKRIYQNEMYHSTKFVSDISLLKLRKPFYNVQSYVSLSGHPDDFAHGKCLNCVIIGFGRTADGLQQDPNLMGYMANSSVAYGPTACALLNSDDDGNEMIRDTWAEFLCSKPDIRMVCPGDSGGPLICNGSLYGIASHGYNFKAKGDFLCGSDHMQTRHLFVYNYRKWIFDIVNGGNPLIPLHRLYIMTSIILVLYYTSLFV